MTYLVIFEVVDAAAVAKLKEKLKSYKLYCPITEHCWAIGSDKGASLLFDELAPFAPAGARLFVIRSGTEAAWKNAFTEKHDEWLKKHL